MNTVLILGGAGFIGKNLTNLLIKNGIRVRILDILAPQIHGHILQNMDWINHPLVDFIRGSICDVRTLKDSLQGISHVIHLAAETGTGQSMYEVAQYNEVNSQGTAVLMDLIVNDRDLDVRHLLLASSRSVYGEGAYSCNCCDSQLGRIFPPGRSIRQLEAGIWEPACESCGGDLSPIPTKEDDLVCPASIYAATKFAQEELVRIGCKAKGINYSILRLQNVYGEGQSLENPYTGILSIFSTRIRRGLHLPVFEDGQETRDFVHVEDVVKVMYECLKVKKPLDTIINVGSGKGTSILEVARMMTDIFEAQVDLKVTSEFRVGDIRHNIADISKLKELLDFDPVVDLSSGLERFSTWVKTQPLPIDRSEQANKQLLSRNLMK